MTIKKLHAFALLVSKHSENYTFQQMQSLNFFPQAWDTRWYKFS